MKKLLSAVLAALIVSAGVMPVYAAAESAETTQSTEGSENTEGEEGEEENKEPPPTEEEQKMIDYIPSLWCTSVATDISEVLANGAVYINTSAIEGENSTIGFSAYIKDEYKCIWSIEAKARVTCPDIVFRNVRLPSEDGLTNAYDQTAPFDYVYWGSYKDIDASNGKRRNFMSISLYLYQDYENRLKVTGDTTDQYPFTLFDLLVDKNAAPGSYKLSYITEDIPETDIFTNEDLPSRVSKRWREKKAEGAIPFAADTKILVSDRQLGDVDGDRTIDSADASKVLESYASVVNGGESGFSTAEEIAADVNGDGQVDASDASQILSFYAELGNGGTGTISEFIAKQD